jgi:hypothetical protein
MSRDLPARRSTQEGDRGRSQPPLFSKNKPREFLTQLLAEHGSWLVPPLVELRALTAARSRQGELAEVMPKNRRKNGPTKYFTR